MKYIVIYSYTSPERSDHESKLKVLKAFEEQVNWHLERDWTPLGGVSIAHTGSWPVYAQAMVKY